jgi:hypothetical protein
MVRAILAGLVGVVDIIRAILAGLILVVGGLRAWRRYPNGRRR